MLQPREIWSTAPPEPRTSTEDKATLLFSWWTTGFAVVIILIRLFGRKVRSNVLFREDWIMMIAMIPLCIRMGLIHVVLLFGTNNVQTVGHEFTAEQLHRRSIGAKVVLAARIFYAMYIWMSKWTVSEFLKRITVRTWRRSYQLTLHSIRVFLVATFIAVIIATLAECQPFNHYWQITPDPGPRCRQGYAHLLTMGTADIVTDILLVAFPIPIVLRSGQTWKRKLQLGALFSTSIALIIVTGMRMPQVISHQGRQQYRTVWASCEILASTFVSNFVIIGSFLRNKGTKKLRYRHASMSDSIDRSSTRRPTMTALTHTGSDENLFRFLGCRVPDHLQEKPDLVPRPAPAALPATKSLSTRRHSEFEITQRLEVHEKNESNELANGSSTEPLPSPTASTLGKKNVSFFDMGGLLEDGQISPGSQSRSTTIVSSGNSHVIAQDFAPSTPSQSRRGSHALMHESAIVQSRGDVNSPTGQRGSLPQSPNGSRPRNAPAGALGSMPERQETSNSRQRSEELLTDRRTTSAASWPTASGQARDSLDHAERNRQYEQQDLHDPGGLLSGNTASDMAPAPWQPSVAPRDRGAGAIASSAQTSDENGEEDGLSLHDPGGLLRR